MTHLPMIGRWVWLELYKNEFFGALTEKDLLVSPTLPHRVSALEGVLPVRNHWLTGPNRILHTLLRVLEDLAVKVSPSIPWMGPIQPRRTLSRERDEEERFNAGNENFLWRRRLLISKEFCRSEKQSSWTKLAKNKDERTKNTNY